MGVYSIAEAKSRLPALIAAAERGEEVTITRRGKTVAEIRPMGEILRNVGGGKRVTPESIAWIADQTKHFPPLDVDAVDLVRSIRDRKL
jgi:prevent-host-death family protein